MKKMSMIIAVMFLALVSAFCLTVETHTIVLVSVVDEVQPQFSIRNNETGASGTRVNYRTNQIAAEDVSTSFDIIQTNSCNYRGKIGFHVSATELVAVKGGKVYSTEGVMILMNGYAFGSAADLQVVYDHNLDAGNAIACFDVCWKTNPSLVDSTYEAAIFLNYTVA